MSNTLNEGVELINLTNLETDFVGVDIFGIDTLVKT